MSVCFDLSKWLFSPGPKEELFLQRIFVLLRSCMQLAKNANWPIVGQFGEIKTCAKNSLALRDPAKGQTPKNDVKVSQQVFSFSQAWPWSWIESSPMKNDRAPRKNKTLDLLTGKKGKEERFSFHPKRSAYFTLRRTFSFVSRRKRKKGKPGN